MQSLHNSFQYVIKYQVILNPIDGMRI